MVFARIRKGGKWEDVHPKVYSGGKWVDAHTRVRVNGKWVELEKPKPPYVPQVHVGTWWATWSEGYWGWRQNNVAHTHYNSLVEHTRLTQGNYEPFHDQFLRDGREGGMFGIDDGNLRATLKGANIKKVEVYLHSLHWAYQNGGEAVVGAHNARGWQNQFSEVHHGLAHVRYTARNQGQWITLPTWVGNDLRDNKLAGITVYSDNTNLWQYGYFAGMNDGGLRPRIRITYEK